MKIWFPTVRGGSGADIHTRRLAAALEKRGVDATVTWFSIYYQFAPFILSRIAPPSGTNVIHALSWWGFAFKRPKVPLLVTEQLDVLGPAFRPYQSGLQLLFHQALIRNFMRESFAAADAVTAVSRSTAASLARTIRCTHARVIPNFVETDVFRPISNPPAVRGPFKLLFMGNLTRRKGADLLAPIMKQLGKNFELRYTTGLRDRRRITAAPNMTSIGKLDGDEELVTAYQACDALLFPSRLEGLPIAVLEAMACAKPVVAARASSMPEVVEHGTTGLLCEPDNVSDFVEACVRLADSPESRGRFGAAGRARVEQLFSERVVVPQYIEVYESLIQKNRADLLLFP